MAKRRRKPARGPKGETEAEVEFRVVFFKKEDGTVPVLTWLEGLSSAKALAQCRVVIELLRQLTFRLHRPHADALREGIRELRASVDQVQYRMLYFFHRRAAVVTHGFIKKGSKVPETEIDRAIAYRDQFLAAPNRHTYVEE